jgi:uncharacterized protein
MRIAQDSASTNSIHSYTAGQIIVHEQVITTSVVITPEKIIEDLLPENVGALNETHFTKLVELHPEIIILGSGSTLHFPPAAYTAELLQQGIGIEVMATDAACRTFNVLLSEERQVVAALFMI